MKETMNDQDNLAKDKRKIAFARIVGIVFLSTAIVAFILNLIPTIPLFITAPFNITTSVLLFVTLYGLFRLPTISTEDITSYRELINALPKETTYKEVDLFKGRSERLIEYYREKLAKNPNNKKIWEKLCTVYTFKKQPDKLITCALQALEIDKDNINILGMLAIAYRRTGEEEKAEEIIQKYNPPMIFRIDVKSDLRKVRKSKE